MKNKAIENILESYSDGLDLIELGGKKPNGYWKDLNNVLNEVRNLMKEHNLDRVPTCNEFNQWGYSGLAMSVNKYHGGIPAIREMMGEKLIRTKHGAWKSLDNVVLEAKKIMKENNFDRLPAQKWFSKNGYSGFVSAVSAYHGGIVNLRRLLGEDSLIRTSGKLKDRNYVMVEVKRIMIENGFDHIPTQKDFQKLGQSSLSHAISHYHGGFAKFRKEQGEKISKMESGTWKNKDFVISEIERVMKENNWKTLPCARMLRERGYTSLSAAIDKDHGGYTAFRKSMGENYRVDMGQWGDREFVIEKLGEVMKKHKLKEIPSSYFLREVGESSLAFAINKYHKGFRSFRESLGQPQAKVAEGSWKSINYTIEQAKKIMAENNLERLPCHENLIKYPGGPSLSRAIMKYYGGFSEFRKYIEQPVEEVDSNQLERVLEEYAGGEE